MMRLLLRWSLRVTVVLAAAFALTYAADFSIYKFRGSPQGKVTVNRYVTIPLKGNKQEFDYLGTLDAPCSRSLFPQAGMAACWQLRRNPNQGLTVE
jgi:hypothetical protein